MKCNREVHSTAADVLSGVLPCENRHIKQTVALYRSKYVGCSFFCRGRYCCIDQVMSPVLDVHGLIVSSIDWFLQPVAKKIYTLKDIICHFLKKINLESFGDQIKKKFNININRKKLTELCVHVFVSFSSFIQVFRFGKIVMNHPKKKRYIFH